MPGCQWLVQMGSHSPSPLPLPSRERRSVGQRGIKGDWLGGEGEVGTAHPTAGTRTYWRCRDENGTMRWMGSPEPRSALEPMVDLVYAWVSPSPSSSPIKGEGSVLPPLVGGSEREGVRLVYLTIACAQTMGGKRIGSKPFLVTDTPAWGFHPSLMALFTSLTKSFIVLSLMTRYSMVGIPSIDHILPLCGCQVS
jgi:hypothetical protein